MLQTRRGVATALAAGLMAIGVFAGSTASASAAGLEGVEVHVPFENWAVWGSLTPKKLDEPVILPKGSTFNGGATGTILSPTEISGTVKGKLFVPPFKAELKLVGLVPTEVGVTLTQVGESEGTITPALPSTCAGEKFFSFCVTASVTSRAYLGISAAGFEGIEVPTECQTKEPVTLTLTTTETVLELQESGAHFTGAADIPDFSCTGLSGVALSPVLDLLVSGPENPFDIHLGRHEPAPPTVETQPASLVSQISAKLNATVDSNGEAERDCHFEYGASPSYGTSVPCWSRPGSASRPRVGKFGVYVPLTGLKEDATYHFRVVATNTLGTSEGADQSFTTLSSAGAPEYGRCVAQRRGEYVDSSCRIKSSRGAKGEFNWLPGPAPTCVAQRKGEYTDATCKAKSAKRHKGSFERAPGPGFTSTSGSLTLETPFLGTPGGTSVVCASSAGSGDVTAVRSGVERITFTGCEWAGKKCASEGSNSTPSGAAGEIITNLLDTRLLGPVLGGGIEAGQGGSSVWTDFTSAEHAPYVVEFGCEGSLFRTTGSVSGVQGGNVGTMSRSSTTTIAGEETGDEGEQALFTELSKDGGSTWAGPDSSRFEAPLENASASVTEIRP